MFVACLGASPIGCVTTEPACVARMRVVMPDVQPELPAKRDAGGEGASGGSPGGLPSTLEGIRREIDAIDLELIALLNRRASMSVQVARVKRTNDAPTYQPGREQEVIRNAQTASAGPLADRHIRAIWSEILSASRDLQRSLKIAYLGPANTFSHRAAEVAARVRFGTFVEYVPCRNFNEVFAVTERGVVDLGVVPVENSVEGSVGGSLDLFVESPLQICSEIRLQITHHLVGHGPYQQAVRVYSHPQALGQCRAWLARNIPNAQAVETSSTASAAERAAADPEGVGIATEGAAVQAGIPVLVRSIQDHAHNTTRFVVLGKSYGARTGNDRTAILFVTQHRPGALHEVLRQLAERGLNLTNIESRPSRRGGDLWEYYFFVDFDGHPDDPLVKDALDAMRLASMTLKVLGSWPIETRIDETPPAVRPVREP